MPHPQQPYANPASARSAPCGRVVYVGRLAEGDGKPAGWVYLVRYPDRSLSGRRIIRGPVPLAIRPRIGETRT